MEDINLDKSKVSNVFIINLLVSVWTKPKRSIRYVIEKNPIIISYILVIIAFFHYAANPYTKNFIGGSTPFSKFIIHSVLIAGIGGPFYLHIASYLYKWGGYMVGGKASIDEVRTALAWSHIPFLYTLPLLVLQIIIFGDKMFMSPLLTLTNIDIIYKIIFAIDIIKIIALFASFALFIKFLEEIQGFTLWKAVCNVFYAIFTALIISLFF